LTKNIDFRLLTKVTVAASLLSGVIAVIMALAGMGVWSLVAKYLINQGTITGLLWFSNRWHPDMIFSIESFKELFGFGSKLLLSGLIGTIFSNIYYAVIGKYFSAQELGFYTRAELFKNIPSQTAQGIITTVGYPVLAKVQDNREQLNQAYKQIINTTFFIVAVLMFGMAAVANSMIITLIGEQWRQSVIYLQLLCFAGLMLPLNSISINLLNVVGRSDLYLKLQLISNILSIPVIILGIIYGIKIMILGICLNSLIAYFYFGKVSSRFSGYTIKNQLKDIAPNLLLAFSMGFVVYISGVLTDFTPLVTFIMQIGIGVVIVLSFGEFAKIREYIFIKGIIIDQYQKFFDNHVSRSDKKGI
jgi:O-antigen/teichoic acid export membrane protein